jgi:hypothetical protein
MRTRYPRWITLPTRSLDKLEPQNLREVGPNLFVGADGSPSYGTRWALVVDLCGRTLDEGAIERDYAPFADKVFSAPFDDGHPIPKGHLEAIVPRVSLARERGPTLVHCAAGLSRSASVAYVVLRMEDGLHHEEALRRVSVPGIEPYYPHPVVLKSARVWLRGQTP